FRDHSACTDHGVTTDRIATYDHSVSSDSRSAFYKSRHVFMFANDVTTRVDYVRKHHAGTTEDIVFQCDSVVHRNVILYLYVIADGGCANIDVLSQRAGRTYSCRGRDMNPMPDPCTGAYLRCSVDDGSRMRAV